jgi:hypothetical protein
MWVCGGSALDRYVVSDSSGNQEMCDHGVVGLAGAPAYEAASNTSLLLFCFGWLYWAGLAWPMQAWARRWCKILASWFRWLVLLHATLLLYCHLRMPLCGLYPSLPAGVFHMLYAYSSSCHVWRPPACMV